MNQCWNWVELGNTLDLRPWNWKSCQIKDSHILSHVETETLQLLNQGELEHQNTESHKNLETSGGSGLKNSKACGLYKLQPKS